MSNHSHVATAMRRAMKVFERMPSHGLHEDATATIVWQGGTRMTACHASGASVDTDMPVELGGSGDCVSPGWLFRSGIGSCAATVIYMTAALEGIDIDDLEVQVGSASDTRGVLGMVDADGTRVRPGAAELQMHIRIGARGVPAARLRALVDEALRRSSIQDVMVSHPPVVVQVQPGDRS